MPKFKVLFLCTHNSARSQIAEGLLRYIHGDKYEVFSAGTTPTKVNPLAIQVMAEIGIDITKQYSKGIEEFKSKDIDLVVSVCKSSAKLKCALCSSPIINDRPLIISEKLNSAKRYLQQPFSDPSEVEASNEEKLAAFRHTRDEIRKWIIAYFSNLNE